MGRYKVLIGGAIAIIVTILLVVLYQDKSDSITKFGGSSVGESLIVMYMVGSDLEDDTNPRDGVGDESNDPGGYATQDLNELVKGLKKNRSNNVDVLIGFGGARTPGWQGIKYMDTDCLMEDSNNDVYGDADCYEKREAKVNMSEQKTYEAFLSYANSRKAGYDRVYLVNWDHGGDYLGFGADTNFDGDILELDEIKSALTDSNSSYDMIGFDACLMASIEVANSVEGATPYLLASEEVEPGHGWQYTEVVEVMANSNDVVEVGKGMVDSFVDSRSHKATSGKTLSLVDISLLQNLKSEIDLAISEGENSYQNFLEAVDNSQPYGMLVTEFSAYAIDLRGLVQSADEGSSQDLSALANAIDDYVIYSKDDGTRPGSSGVSIYSVENFKMWDSGTYSEEVAATDAWYEAVDQLFTDVRNDTERPQISDVGKCQDGEEHEFCATITDNVGVMTAALANGYMLDADNFLVYRSELLDNYSSTGYYANQNVTNVFGLCNPGLGGCAQSLSLALNQMKVGDGNRYISPAIVNGNKAVIFLQFDDDGDVQDQWYITYTTSGSKIFPSKVQMELVSGDVVQGYYRVISRNSGQMSLVEGSETMTLANDFGWTENAYQADPSKITLFIFAVDYKENHSVVVY
ncbi:MAG: clostripain-related cysteine peptidase [Candidatus Dojkabacteria bacterium]|nr:MAG: clostripain-related cysteine peptidase [Candidatus Dojkabacteria bacterium]